MPSDTLAIYKVECRRKYPELGEEAPQRILSLVIDSIAAPDKSWTVIIPNIPIEIWEKWREIAAKLYEAFFELRHTIDALPEWVREFGKEALRMGRVEPDDVIAMIIFGAYWGATQITPPPFKVNRDVSGEQKDTGA